MVRADNHRVFVQVVPNNGTPQAEMPVSFYGPDRAFVTDGPDAGQSIESIRAPDSRVMWIRVVGRIARRAPGV